MKKKKIFARFILYVLYVVSICIMLTDLRYEKTEAHLLYILTNGMLVFRLLGVWFFPWMLHMSCVAYMAYYFGTLHYAYVNTFNAVIVTIPVVVQAVASLHFVFFRPGRTKSQRACRVGIHSVLGLTVVIMYYWILCFLIKDNDFQCICEMAYMFVFLIMILTPQFMTKGQAVAQARSERNRASRRRAQPETGSSPSPAQSPSHSPDAPKQKKESSPQRKSTRSDKSRSKV